MSETEQPLQHAPGAYAIVELFGHTTLVGRIEEVERFGSKMLSIEALFRDTLLPPVLYGGAAIYGLTECSAEIAYKRQARKEWLLPVAMRSIVPPLLLAAPIDSVVVDGSDGGGEGEDDE